jgi:hypothetical protein
MREKTVKRYYCDYCRKGMFKRPMMALHEKSCCLNPDRECYTCKEKRNFRVIVAVHKLTDRERIDSLTQDEVTLYLAKVDQCPTCLLAIFRLLNLFPAEPWNYQDARNAYERGPEPDV